MRKVVFIVCACIVVFGGAVSAAFFMPRFAVTHIVVSGTNVLKPAEIESTVQNALSAQTIFGIIPRKSIVTVSPGTLEDTIREIYPRIKTINITRSWPDTLLVDVRERQMWGVYCAAGTLIVPQVAQSATEESVQDQCFFIDEQGVPLDVAPQFQGSLVPVVTRASGGEPVHLGQAVFSEAAVTTMRLFAQGLREKLGVSVREFILGAEYREQIFLVTAEGWRIIAEESMDIPMALENLALVFRNQLADRMGLEYVDLRFAHKVFYKFQDGTLGEK